MARTPKTRMGSSFRNMILIPLLVAAIGFGTVQLTTPKAHAATVSTHRTLIPMHNPQPGTDGSFLGAAMSGCSWYTIVESTWYGGPAWDRNNLYMDISLLGQYSSSGRYCGLASDHVCATPRDNGYLGGLIVNNWWYVNGNYQRTIQNRFHPYKGQTVCSYSGSFGASRTADADGQWTDATENIVGTHGIGTQF